MTEVAQSVSDPWIWFSIGFAITAGFFSCLQLALGDFTRSELEDRLNGSGRQDRIEWLFAHLDEAVVAVAIWRRLAVVAFICSVMMLVTGGLAQGVLGLSEMLIGGAISFTWIWVINVGLARAAAEHAGSIIVGSTMWMLPVLRIAALPMSAPLQLLNEAVRRLVGAEQRDDLEDDLLQIMEESEREGHLGEAEKEMIQAIVDFRTCTVGEIMTPRIDIEGIRLTDDLQSIKQRVIEEGHSRFPVYDENLDQIEGILYAKDLMRLIGEDPTRFDLRPLLRQAILVPESRRISDLLVEFQNKQVHMAIVIDEYGGTAGLVTIEDIVEEIVGEIRDEHDMDEPESVEIEKQADGSAVVDGRVRVDELNDELGLSLPEDSDFDTVAGWVFSTAGRIPDTGEIFQIDGVQVTVLQVDRTRLQRLHVVPLDQANPTMSSPDPTPVEESP